MIKDLYQYFQPQQEIYLDKISYERINNRVDKEEQLLECTDNISVDRNSESGVKVLVKRSLKFEPEDFFSLSISFGADLKFNEKKPESFKWEDVNLAEEFRYNGEFVTNNLMSRISLLIAEITSSFGQQPLILIPNVAKSSDERTE